MKKDLWALLPFFVFIVLFAEGGIISGDFYAMPALVAFCSRLIRRNDTKQGTFF